MIRVHAFVVALAALLACGQVERPDPLAKGCALYQPMDEVMWNGTVGEVVDACGGDDLGTARPGVTTVPNGSRGRAAKFATRAGCIEVPDSPNLRPTAALTMSAWIQPTALSDQSQEAFGIISKRVRKDIEDAFNVSVWTGNKIWVELADSGDRFPGKAALVNGRWTQVTIVYDGARLPGERVRSYLDGALDSVDPESSASLGSSGVPLRVGCMPAVDDAGVMVNQGFIGLIDDVVVWTRALDDVEVSTWYELSHP
jgi:Concanavalin A-like lectin/glucanases superfamily